MKKYPEKYWEKEDLDRMKSAYLGLGEKETECPAPNCNGVVKIKRDEDINPKYKKKGDFFLDIECGKCQRSDLVTIKGNF